MQSSHEAHHARTANSPAVEKITEYLRVLTSRFTSGVLEIRAVDCSERFNPKPHIECGFFDLSHLHEAATAAITLQSKNARGVYFTLNPVRPDLLSRRANRTAPQNNRDQISAGDSDIVRRCWLLIDADPARISGVSSSQQEKEVAAKLSEEVETYLSLSGWPDPIKADSGNGFHLLYAIDIPVDDGGLVRNCLRALAAQFDSNSVKIDTVVYNPSRICKLYGTISRKGDHTAERPHRYSKIIGGPKSPIIVPEELLKKLATQAPPERAFSRTSGTHTPAGKPSRSRKKSRSQKTPVELAELYLSKVPPAISGQGGHNQLYHAAGILTDGFALSIDDALPILQHWNESCQPPWGESDLERKLIEADKNLPKSGRLLERMDGETPASSPQTLSDLMILMDGIDQSETPTRPSEVKLDATPTHTPAPPTPASIIPIVNGYESEAGIIPVPMHVIREHIIKTTSGWPKRVASSLFIHTPGSTEVDWLEKTSSLFAWIGAAAQVPPVFHRDPACHSREEVFADLTRTAESFDAVESLPHEPPIPGHYYTYPTPPPGNGDALAGLVNRFNPETPIDRDLIVAMFATVLWGGGGGCRPAFVITSDRGRGSGKSTLASILTQFAGGGLEISANEDAKSMKERLLSPDGLRKRVAILDNVKTLRFSWAELEALITSPVISGRRMYAGEGSRPNNLTWVITLNGIALSTDMAQRVVVIKINRPEHSGSWEDDTRQYLQTYRHEIIADLIEVLRSPTIELDQYTRWGKWERDVLSRMPDPNEAQKVIAERQAAGNVETDESELLEGYILEQLESLGYDTLGVQVMIPSSVLHRWFNDATGERRSTIDVGRIVSQKIAEKAVKRLQKYRTSNSRGVSWTGEEWLANNGTHWDLEERIDNQKKQDRRGF